MSLQNEDDWRVTVDIPLNLTHEDRHQLLDRVEAALRAWLAYMDHPDKDPRTWEPFLSAGAADHTLEAYADRLEAQLEQARQRLADAEERLHTLRTAPKHRLREPNAGFVAPAEVDFQADFQRGLINYPAPPPMEDQTTIRQAEGNLPTPYPRPTEAQLDSLAEQALKEMP